MENTNATKVLFIGSCQGHVEYVKGILLSGFSLLLELKTLISSSSRYLGKVVVNVM